MNSYFLISNTFSFISQSPPPTPSPPPHHCQRQTLKPAFSQLTPSSPQPSTPSQTRDKRGELQPPRPQPRTSEPDPGLAGPLARSAGSSRHVLFPAFLMTLLQHSRTADLWSCHGRRKLQFLQVRRPGGGGWGGGQKLNTCFPINLQIKTILRHFHHKSGRADI